MKVRLYYRQVWDENGNLHEIKTTSESELSNEEERGNSKWVQSRKQNGT